MSEQRPQYGEYATPEEQRIRAGRAPVDAEPAAAAPTPVVNTPAAPSVTDIQRKPSTPDRIATIALLAFGLLNVLSMFGQFMDLEPVMTRAMTMLGIEGEFTNYAGAKLWGTIAALVGLAGWAITAWLSVRRLRARRLAWWIPLVGGLAVYIATAICLAFVMAGDPAFFATVR